MHQCYVEPTSGNSDYPKCTNTPIYCTLCPVSNHGHPHTIWKYTAHVHLISQHAPVDKDSSPTLAVPAQMAVNMFISQAEGEHMGLEASKTDEYVEARRFETVSVAEGNKSETIPRGSFREIL